MKRVVKAVKVLTEQKRPVWPMRRVANQIGRFIAFWATFETPRQLFYRKEAQIFGAFSGNFEIRPKIHFYLGKDIILNKNI